MGSGNADVDAILRDKQQELEALMEAIAADEPDIDLKIAQIVEGESEEVKLGIVAHVRDMLRQREQEEAQAAELAQTEEQKRLHEAERRTFRQWLAWLMHDATLKKLRLAMLLPLLRQQGVKDIGKALIEQGVTLSVAATNRRELGRLASLAQQAKEREQGRKR